MYDLPQNDPYYIFMNLDLWCPPYTMGDVLVLRKTFEGSWSFFYFNVGDHMGDKPK